MTLTVTLDGIEFVVEGEYTSDSGHWEDYGSTKTWFEEAAGFDIESVCVADIDIMDLLRDETLIDLTELCMAQIDDDHADEGLERKEDARRDQPDWRKNR